MFTGIVQTTAKIVEISEKGLARRHVIQLPSPWSQGLEIGASVAHNGCCLTVVAIEDEQIHFDLIAETLARTNLGTLAVGDAVNIERAARYGDEIGGHMMSGHILTTAPVVKVVNDGHQYQVWVGIEPEMADYVLEKGYIGIDGISLTIGEVSEDCFALNLIPETLSRTIIGQRQVGDRVNIEIDPQTQAIVDTVARYLAKQQG
ncbi:Riboflavin synthase [Vibrio stylophorae]|uniref:Riboflavin synthase n=1 Tax=Vibrio stylophorae TaxID=659351 RepID=A0ABM8ZSY7_9VIBR|nr:riboflavin synthase subunit alpha [Vibrio stylophorae]CAH0533413.1 Riboflavin synthase [Vibrio stylophorae]